MLLYRECTYWFKLPSKIIPQKQILKKKNRKLQTFIGTVNICITP